MLICLKRVLDWIPRIGQGRLAHRPLGTLLVHLKLDRQGPNEEVFLKDHSLNDLSRNNTYFGASTVSPQFKDYMNNLGL